MAPAIWDLVRALDMLFVGWLCSDAGVLSSEPRAENQRKIRAGRRFLPTPAVRKKSFACDQLPT